MPVEGKRKLWLSLKRDEVLQATRVSIGKQKLVYILVADKRLQYPKGKSRIVYVGTACPICHAEVRPDARYPRYVCPSCVDKVTDATGRPVRFVNTGFDGAFKAVY